MRSSKHAACTLRILALAALNWAAACSSDSYEPPPNPHREAPGEFDELKLEINGRDALGRTLTFAPRQELVITGGFRFVKPYRGRAPFGSMIVDVTLPDEEGGEVTAASASITLKFKGDRRVEFACKAPAPPLAREYDFKVIGKRTIVIKTKIRVEK